MATHCVGQAHVVRFSVTILGSPSGCSGAINRTRGNRAASSDLDLLVDMTEGRTLFDLIALSNDLEESLGVEVDVVTEASLSPYMRDRVLAEAVALCGAEA